MSQREEGPVDADGDLNAFKDYLSEPRFRIRLDDQVNAAVRAALAETSAEKFPLDPSRVSGEDFADRLAAYETAVRPLQAKAALLGRWATPEQLPTLTNMLARMSDGCADTQSGQSMWVDLRLYPLSLLLYCVGIASLAADNYRAFAVAHSKMIDARTRRSGSRGINIVVPVVDAMQDVASTSAWRHVEAYKQKRVPESEHLFKVLRPVLDELLFLGSSYERLFDRYEILRALIYAEVTDTGRGPVGRFGWKYYGGEDNPFADLRAEAAREKDDWGPVRAGLFRGAYERFEQTAAKFEKDFLSRLGWH
ncbi:hypothetical protein [Tautonia sociabilis]|uniref:Uncharacterized protein n=1 Tax=Tautonia sociabilis TaxID=2080755 RepID=A0A432ME71_9BACT|nr:hypothetical protein [Tautonia sociabilis]RUL83547.1 hypothetical protein TsocGM_21825 [Tautonia sociabilis]